jgi:hypothetical protein
VKRAAYRKPGLARPATQLIEFGHGQA